MKILKLSLAVLLSIGMAGCNFMDENPDSRTTIDKPEKIAKLLISAYPNCNYAQMFEYMSDNTVDNGLLYTYYNDTQYESWNLLDITGTSQDTPYYNWSGCYSAISTANLALESIEKLNDPSVCDAQRGEALLCRAWAHFQLAQIFCQPYNPVSSDTDLGIPYATVIETTAINKYERGTVAEVYKKIYDDIEEALPLINDAAYTEPKYHFNSRAAYAFAAEFNLHYLKYDKAIQYATIALTENPVLRDMAAIRALSSGTDIRNMYISSESAANLMLLPTVSNAGSYAYTGYYRFTHTTYMTNTQTLKTLGPWNTLGLWAYQGGIFGTTITNLIPKMYGIFETTNVLANTGYYHVVMMPFTTDKTILNRAEAYTMLKMYNEAAADLNTWYNAKHNVSLNLSVADITEFYWNASPRLDDQGNPVEIPETIKNIVKPLTGTRLDIALGTDQEYMIQACLHARRIETIHEGYRFNDLKRFGIGYTKVSAEYGDIVVEPYDKRVAIQLPSAVISAGLEPNPR